MSFKRVAQILCVMALLCGMAFSQSESGTLTGTVVDSSNAAVPGAQLEAKNLTTGFVRSTVSGPEGLFAFNSLEPAKYNLTIKAAGFKAYAENNIEITANAPRDLGRIALALGAVTEEISVTAIATPVQTTSSENSTLVDETEAMEIALKGRDLFAILQTVPGVYMGNTYLTGGDATSETNGMGSLNINGTGGERANFTVDGVTDLDTGNNGQTDFEPTMDTIAEIRVLTSNYQAEFGRTSGGTITVVTKGGGQQFHGTAYVNKRHEMFNANSFFNHLSNTPKPIYRFFVYGYTIGGPIYIPKHFNSQKKKLFFFFSQEYTIQKPATANNTASVPTTNVGANGSVITGLNVAGGEAQGNPFDRCAASAAAPCTAGYYNSSGVLENSQILNPANGKAPLAPGTTLSSLIGTSFYDATSAKYGQAMMAFEPPPNMCTAASGIYNGAAISPTNCPAGFTTTGISTSNNYSANYFYQFVETHPRRNNTFRVDYNVTSKLTAWGRYIKDYDQDDTNPTLPAKGSAGTWEDQSAYHPFPGHGYAAGATYTINPTTVNEFTFGRSWSSWSYYPYDQSQLNRSNMGNPPSFDNFATDPLFTADVNQIRPTLSSGSENYQVGVPSTSFGSSNGPSETGGGGLSCGLGQCPITTFTWTDSINDNVSKVIGKHNLKAGIFWEHAYKSQAGTQGSYLGAYNFGTGGVLMPADTQDGFANAWLGNMNTYSEGQRVVGNFYYTNVEAFVQDNWRVSRRLTLDLGIRFAHMSPFNDVTPGQSAEYLPSAYAQATPERIWYPACMTPGTTTVISTFASTSGCATADLTAWDPTTQTKQLYSFQGGLIPASVGGYSSTPNPFPGMVVAGTGALPINMYTTRSVTPEPRLGFAWDVFGNGKTSVRGGIGIFVNRTDFNLLFDATGQQPTAVSRSVYYTTVNSLTTPTVQNTANITPISPAMDFTGNQHIESTYNGSFQIQQNVGFSTVLGVSWVFALRRHIPFQQAINYSPNFSQYNPAWENANVQYLANPAKNGGLTQGNASGLDYSSNYFYGPNLCGGCVFGLGTPEHDGFGESTNYHSLQITIRRNMTKHLSYGLAYTYSKLMGLSQGSIGNGSDGSTESSIFPDKFRNWGPAYLPTPQLAEINYVYEIPNLGQKLNFKPLGWVTDHWSWSGLTQVRSDIMTGVPSPSVTANSSGTTNPGENWTGGSEGARAFVVGNYHLSSIGQSPQFNGLGAAASLGAVTSAPLGTGPSALQEEAGGVSSTYTTTSYNAFPNGSAGNQIINEAFVQYPYPCSLTPAANPVYGVGESMECFGNAGAGSLVNVPGTRIFNFDMTFAKNFPLKSEKRVLIFRAEMYNVFNHAQFSGDNITPSYDWNNWKNGVLVQTSNTLGRYTGTVNPRQMSMSLRFQF